MDGFRRTDRELILSLVTDDVVWKIPGGFEIKGKSAFSAHIVDEGFKNNPEIVIERVVEGPNVVVAEGTEDLKSLSVASAVAELDLTGAPVIVFQHAGSGRVNVVYRRRDGAIGWLDPQAPREPSRAA